MSNEKHQVDQISNKEIDSIIEIEDHVPEPKLKRTLKARHLAMISLGGVIGQGLFLSAGGNLNRAGPAGALIAYAIIGFIVYWVTFSLGEMSTYIPVSGSFTVFCRRFVDTSFGTTIGYNYWACWSIIVASELTALPLVMEFWTDRVPGWAWSGIWLVVIYTLNVFGARSYGEAEYWFSVIKIVAVLVFIIVGCITSGGLIGNTTPHEVYGFKYWNDPGAFSNGALGVVNAFVLASFSMQGTEIVGITAGECENPVKQVPRAIRNVFWRIIIFYLGSVFIMGMLIPYDDPRNLSGSNSVTVSPFTIVFGKAGLQSVAHIMNTVILITVLSCANSGMYVSSRMLCALSNEGLAHRKLSQISRRGVPLYSLTCTALVCLITFATSFIPGKALFIVLTNLSGVAGFVTWGGICFSHYRFRKALKCQGRTVKDLPITTPFHPFGDLFGMVACVVIALMAGYSYFVPPNAVGLIGNYGGLVCILILFIVLKFWTKSKMIPIDEIDLDTGRADYSSDLMTKEGEEDDSDKTGPIWKRIWKKFVYIVT
ncbi:amino acid permease/ SLC12A domain-containing protein [Cokeromyces recurvatus]|uniref:amino acid permease/ SLC12A domain-containing protein n=1 Tax=Cokeromyces recurvatus TaxID=90255 RepID=UPI00221FFE67|nr:amino acid permease/ SLC12A domain-containing protein [Cokeromyces recurvatus]KAI7898062.1 amino acid permease/ SLC12A domain-containing protein [Cokeromyces recurvatus]